MGVQVLVEFDLSAAEIERLFDVQKAKRRLFLLAAVFSVVGLGLISLGVATGTIRLGLPGAFMLFIGLVAVPVTMNATKTAKSSTRRLPGPTRVHFSDQGMQYAGPEVARRVTWSQVQHYTVRAESWIIRTQAGLYVIPKSAFTPEQAEQFVALATAAKVKKLATREAA